MQDFGGVFDAFATNTESAEVVCLMPIASKQGRRL